MGSVGALWVLPNLSVKHIYKTPTTWQPSIVLLAPETGDSWGYVRIFSSTDAGDIQAQDFYSACFCPYDTAIITYKEWFWPAYFKPEHIPTEVVKWNLLRLLQTTQQNSQPSSF